MGTIRVNKNKDNPYLIMNKTGLQDTILSWKAKGLLAYLLSLPDDWKVYVDELSNHSKDGLKSTTSGIKELMDSGYMERKLIKDKLGRFEGYDYTLSEMPKTGNGKTENGKGQATNYLSELSIKELNNESIKGVKEKLSLDTFLESNYLTSINFLTEATECIRYYVDKLYNYKGVVSKYTTKEWFDIFDDIFLNNINQDSDADIEIIKDAIDNHFKIIYKNKEMYYLHNFKDTTKDNRLYEAGIL